MGQPDVVAVGTGAIGAATAFEIAKTGEFGPVARPEQQDRSRLHGRPDPAQSSGCTIRDP